MWFFLFLPFPEPIGDTSNVVRHHILREGKGLGIASPRAKRPPALTRHRGRGLARVRFGGRDYYGSPCGRGKKPSADAEAWCQTMLDRWRTGGGPAFTLHGLSVVPSKSDRPVRVLPRQTPVLFRSEHTKNNTFFSKDTAATPFGGKR